MQRSKFIFKYRKILTAPIWSILIKQQKRISVILITTGLSKSELFVNNAG